VVLHRTVHTLDRIAAVVAALVRTQVDLDAVAAAAVAAAVHTPGVEEKSDPAAAAAVAVVDIRAVEEKSDPVAAPAVAVVAYIRVAVVEAYAYLLVDIVALRAVYSSPNCVVVAATADSSFVLPPVVGAAAVRVALWTWHHQTVAGSDSVVAVRLMASASRVVVVARGHVVWSRRRFHRTVKDSGFAWLRQWRNRTGRDPDLDSVGSGAVVVREEDRLLRLPWHQTVMHQTVEDWDFGALVPRFHHQTVQDWDC